MIYFVHNVGFQSDFLNIAVKNGGIIVTVNLGSGVFEKMVEAEGYRFDDNHWHHLVVKRQSREVKYIMLI